MSFFSDPNRIPESYGLRIAAGLIAYFVIMKVINLGHHVELRLLNLVILTQFSSTRTASIIFAD